MGSFKYSLPHDKMLGLCVLAPDRFVCSFVNVIGTSQNRYFC